MTGAVRTILFATELTVESAGAVRRCRWLAERLGRSGAVRLHVAHVIEPAGRLAAEVMPGLIEKQAAIIEDELRLFAESHGIAAAKRHVLHGDPVIALLALARGLSADVLVVGRFGDGGPKVGHLGVIADRLVRQAGCAVLVVPPQAGEAVERIGVATDFDEGSAGVVSRGVELAAELGIAHVDLLHVYRVPRGYHMICSHAEAVGRMEDLARVRAAELVHAGRARAGADAPTVALRFAEGDAGGRIAELAAGLGLDLLVIGAHARGRSVFGRTAETIVRAAPCAVWIERPA